jgi:hypothetical protein
MGSEVNNDFDFVVYLCCLPDAPEVGKRKPAGKSSGRLRHHRFYQRPDYIFLHQNVANDPPGRYHQPGPQHVMADEIFFNIDAYRFLFFVFLPAYKQNQIRAVKDAYGRNQRNHGRYEFQNIAKGFYYGQQYLSFCCFQHNLVYHFYLHFQTIPESKGP